MNDKVFLDSNILIYAHTDVDPVKQETAQQLIEHNNSVVSTQVLQETANTLFKKFKHSWTDIPNVLSDISRNNFLHINSEKTVVNACNIAEKYQFSFYDSLIVSSALEAECTLLYSEDLQHNQVIENQLRVINPFI